MNRQIVLYGVVLALLAILLNLVDFYYMVRNFSLELYIGLVAVFFLAVGIWAGRKLTGQPESPDDFQPNVKALDYLGITERELEVLELMAEGCSNRQIADRLFISINTVKTHVSNLLGKLNADRRTQAIGMAKSLKLIP